MCVWVTNAQCTLNRPSILTLYVSVVARCLRTMQSPKTFIYKPSGFRQNSLHHKLSLTDSFCESKMLSNVSLLRHAFKYFSGKMTIDLLHFFEALSQPKCATTSINLY